MSTVRFISGKAALAKFIGGITDEARGGSSASNVTIEKAVMVFTPIG